MLQTLADGCVIVLPCAPLCFPCDLNRTEYVYKNGLQIDFFIYFVPAAPGLTRTFFAMKTGAAPTPVSTPDSASGTSSKAGSTDSASASAPAPAPASSAKPSGAAGMMGLMQKFPHWLISPHRVTDQDVVAMALTVGCEVTAWECALGAACTATAAATAAVELL